MHFSTQPWYPPLREIADQLNSHGIPYRIVGGVALVLHGVPIRTTDIDVETDQAGAYSVQELFPDRVVLPVDWRESESYRSHFGRLDFGGVQVEIMGQIERRDGSKWVNTAVCTTATIDLDGVPVRVPWLEEEVLANIRRGRMERASQCMKYCNAEQMVQLIRGRVPTHVV